MSDDKGGGGKSPGDSVQVPLDDYKRMLRDDVEKRLWGRIWKIATVLGLAGVAGYLSLFKFVLEPVTDDLNKKVNEQLARSVQTIEERSARSAQAVTEEVRREVNALVARQVTQAVVEHTTRTNLDASVKRELEDTGSEMRRAIDRAVGNVILNRFGNAEFREAIDLSVLSAQVMSAEQAPQRRSFSFGQILHLANGPKEAHDLVARLLQARLEGTSVEAVSLMVQQFAADPRTVPLTTRDLARHALDRAVDGLPPDAVHALLARLPAADAAALLRTAAYANSPAMDVALELLRRDERLEALSALAMIAANASPGLATRVLERIGGRDRVPADAEGLRRGPEAWRSLLQEVLSTRGPAAVLGASELDLPTLVGLRVVASAPGPGTAEIVSRTAQHLSDRREALLRQGLPADAADHLAAAGAPAPRLARDRLRAEQQRRAALVPLLNLDAADDAQRRQREAMRKLLPLPDGQGAPPWWDTTAGLLDGIGTPAERVAAAVLLADRVVREDAEAEAVRIMRLDLLRRIGRSPGVLDHPAGTRAATALLAAAPSVPTCAEGLRTLADAAPDRILPLLLAAAACRERMPVPDLLPPLEGVLRAAAALPPAESERLGLALVAALVREAPATASRPEGRNLWAALMRSLPPLPPAGDPAREAIAQAYATLLAHGGTGARDALEEAGGRNLVALPPGGDGAVVRLGRAARSVPGLGWMDARWRDPSGQADAAVPVARPEPGRTIRLGDILGQTRQEGEFRWVHLAAVAEPLRWRVALGEERAGIVSISLGDGRVHLRGTERDPVPMEGEGPWLLRVPTPRGTEAALASVQLDVGPERLRAARFLADAPDGTGATAPENETLGFGRDLVAERFLAFDLRPDERYELETLNLSARVDTVVRLLDSNGRELAQDDDGGSNLASRLRLPPGLSGRHVVGVENIGRSGAFDLILRVIGPLPPGPPLAEPGGGPARLGTAYGLALAADAERRVWFDLEAGRRYVFSTHNLAPGVDTMLTLRDGSDDSLGEDDDGGEGRLASALTVDVRTAGRHVLVVRNIGASGDFELRAAEAGPAIAPRAALQVRSPPSRP